VTTQDLSRKRRKRTLLFHPLRQETAPAHEGEAFNDERLGLQEPGLGTSSERTKERTNRAHPAISGSGSQIEKDKIY